MICRHNTIYNKHETMKIGNQIEKNRKDYEKCSKNFADDYKLISIIFMAYFYIISNKIIRALAIIYAIKLVPNAVL